ncbi:uncharacterized protein LOC142590577 isoform X2 [Dermacentor variabilis]|uniref:uncharacterized protein LOC142590577 isoform X2 n=1 Tax=Dermacentor variabilis TaxID=34621 RepID=UPI003F5B8C68
MKVLIIWVPYDRSCKALCSTARNKPQQLLANKIGMKFLYYTCFLTCLCAVFCFGEPIHGFGFKSKQGRIRETVEKLLQGRGELMISRGKYERTDYPMCVRSRPLGYSAGKMHHNLSYYERDIKASQTHGHRLYRNSFFELPKTRKRIINIYAYLGTGQVDNKISGWYNVLYADKICFILATEEQAMPACLLWRKVRATLVERVPCRKAYKERCRQYKGHSHVYSKAECITKNNL